MSLYVRSKQGYNKNYIMIGYKILEWVPYMKDFLDWSPGRCQQLIVSIQKVKVNSIVSLSSNFFLSAFFRNFFLCWDRWNGDVTPTLDGTLMWSSRAGSDLGCVSRSAACLDVIIEPLLYISDTHLGMVIFMVFLKMDHPTTRWYLRRHQLRAPEWVKL